MISRNGDMLSRFDALADQLGRLLDVDEALIDGEVIVVDETGRPQFYELLRVARSACYVAFDILWHVETFIPVRRYDARQKMLAWQLTLLAPDRHRRPLLPRNNHRPERAGIFVAAPGCLKGIELGDRRVDVAVDFACGGVSATVLVPECNSHHIMSIHPLGELRGDITVRKFFAILRSGHRFARVHHV